MVGISRHHVRCRYNRLGSCYRVYKLLFSCSCIYKLLIELPVGAFHAVFCENTVQTHSEAVAAPEAPVPLASTEHETSRHSRTIDLSAVMLNEVPVIAAPIAPAKPKFIFQCPVDYPYPGVSGVPVFWFVCHAHRLAKPELQTLKIQSQALGLCAQMPSASAVSGQHGVPETNAGTNRSIEHPVRYELVVTFSELFHV